MKLFPSRLFLFVLVTMVTLRAQDRIPFYEDFIEAGNLDEYLELAHRQLDEKPDAKESPRLALDLIMMGKATEDLKSVMRGTDLLLFDYLGTLPSLHFISSFDKGSPRLTQLLKVKLNEADLNDLNFSNTFADTLVLLNRIHGAELMNDPSLLLESYLVVEKSENRKLLDSLSEALDIIEKNSGRFSEIISLCRSESSVFKKLSELHQRKDFGTDFLVKFFTAQLSASEKKSPEFLDLMINSSLWGENKKPDLALHYLSTLPDELASLPKYQISTAFAHLIKGNHETSITLLKSISQAKINTDSPDTWNHLADSMQDGLEFRESRSSLFLQQLDKVYENWQREQDAFLIEGSWGPADSDHPIEFFIGVSKAKQSFEIHFHQNKQPFFLYKMTPENCHIFTPAGKYLLFTKDGAYPLPKIEVSRDIDAGSFNYSFNLNFGRKFEEFNQQICDNLDISYLSTIKGREVLLNHIIDRQGIWFSPPASSDQGTVFTLHKIDPVQKSITNKIEISPSGKLVSLTLGKLQITNFSSGSEDLLESLPKWPDSPKPTKKANFQLSTLIESIEELLEGNSSSL
jgi:hypothetical protein